MLTVHVFFQVKPECIEEFIRLAPSNVFNSRQEDGVVRFEALRQQDDAARFMFVECYKTPDDQLKHRETEHFKGWKAAVMDLLVEPYTFVKYDTVI